MSGMTTFAERFAADFRAAMAAAGPVPMVVAENTGEGDAAHTVDALARELGEQRYKDPNVSAFADERGRLATAEYVAADLPVNLKRGDGVRIFGADWIVRAAERKGEGGGQIIKLWLATDERTRGR